MANWKKVWQRTGINRKENDIQLSTFANYLYSLSKAKLVMVYIKLFFLSLTDTRLIQLAP